LLDTYEAERKPHVEALVNFAIQAGEVIGELDLDKARARDAAMRDLLRSGQAETIRQRYVPNLSAGVLDPASGAVAGTLFVQPRVGTQREGALLDDVVGPNFLLVTTGAEAQAWLSPSSLDLWRRLGGERVVLGARPEGDVGGVRHLSERGTMFADWMASLGAAAVVARPDRYVYGVARNGKELNRMIEGLGRQIFG